MSLPIYNQIKNRLQESKTLDKDLSISEKKTLIQNIVSNQKVHSLIYVMIKKYQLEYENYQHYILPYAGKKLKSGIRFDLDKLPIQLKRIVNEFVNIHISSNK
tara:strand:+ start:625 stop:933 length:309 start_codon:yes stop_codon:yes gene_type:complete